MWSGRAAAKRKHRMSGIILGGLEFGRPGRPGKPHPANRENSKPTSDAGRCGVHRGAFPIKTVK